MGLVLRDVTPAMAQTNGLPSTGALIVEVAPGSPAERAELRPGMVVIEAGRKPIGAADDLTRIIKASKSGSTVLLRVMVPNGGKMLRAVQVP